MDETNKDVVKAFFAALGKGDVESLRSLLDPEIQAIATGTSQMSGTRDYQAVLDAAKMLNAITQNGIAFSIVSMTAEEDRVSAEVEGRAVLKNGKPYNNQYHFLLTIRGGKVLKMKEYFCTKLADAALLPVLAEIGLK